MINKGKAQKMILDLVNQSDQHVDDEFIISSIELSENKDYWIIVANSRAFIENNDFSRCYVGVRAYLVNTESAEIEVVGSGESIEDYLQDKNDIAVANGQMYVLACGFNKQDKQGIVHLHQVLKCSLSDAKILCRQKTVWFTAIKRDLLVAQQILNERKIITHIELIDPNKTLPENQVSIWNLDNISQLILSRTRN